MRLPPALVALTPGDLERERIPAFLERLAGACSAGLPGLLVREPRLTDREWLALLEEVRSRRGAELWLGVHDRAHLVRAVEADGLHLGFRSLPPAVARDVAGDLRVSAQSTSIRGERITGSASIETTYGGVRLSGVGGAVHRAGASG